MIIENGAKFVQVETAPRQLEKREINTGLSDGITWLSRKPVIRQEIYAQHFNDEEHTWTPTQLNDELMGVQCVLGGIPIA